MELLGFLIPVSVTAILAGVVAVIVIARAPNYTPKPVISQTMSSIAQDLFQLRQAMHSYIGEALNAYAVHDPATFSSHTAAIDSMIRQLRYRVTTASNYVETYSGHHSQANYYNLARGAVTTIGHITDSMTDIRDESDHLERVIADVQRVDQMTREPAITDTIHDDRKSIDRATLHLETIIGYITQTRQELSKHNFKTEDFRQIRDLLDETLSHAERDYTQLRHILTSNQLDQFRSRHRAMPPLLLRFDFDKYMTIASRPFQSQPEAQYLAELQRQR